MVRLWPESFDQYRRVWRGDVADTGTGARRYFARWEDLLEFLCKAIDMSWDGNVASEIMTEVMRHEPDQERNEPID